MAAVISRSDCGRAVLDTGELADVLDGGDDVVVGLGVDDVDLHAEVLELAAQLGLDATGGQNEVRRVRSGLLDVGTVEVADLGQALGFLGVVVVARAGDHLVAGADGVDDLGVGRRQAHDAGGRLVQRDLGAGVVGDGDGAGCGRGEGELEVVAVSSPEPQAPKATTPSARTAARRSAAVRRPKRMLVMMVVTPFET